MREKKKPVCLVTGVGPGAGKAIVAEFISKGYVVVMIARTPERLKEISATHNDAYSYPCDVTDRALLTATIAEVRRKIGSPSVVIHNAVGGAFGNFMQIEPEVLEYNFQVNTMALLHLAQLTVQNMLDNGGGAIIGTGNTSAYRGKGNFAGFAPTKAAQRILLESIAREVGPYGIHAAYVAIDAVIDVPWTREMAPGKPDDFFARPEDIAKEIYHIAHQPSSTWTSDHTIRPFGEVW